MSYIKSRSSKSDGCVVKSLIPILIVTVLVGAVEQTYSYIFVDQNVFHKILLDSYTLSKFVIFIQIPQKLILSDPNFESNRIRSD